MGQFNDGDTLRHKRIASKEISHSHTVTPPLAAIDGTTFRLNTADYEQQDQVPATQDSFQLRRTARGFMGRQIIAPVLLPVLVNGRRLRRCSSCCALASAGATSSNAARCLSMSASVCWTEMVHCSSHQ